MAKKKKSKSSSSSSLIKQEIFGIVLLSFGILLFLSVYFKDGTIGVFGNFVKDIIKGLFGNFVALIIPVCIIAFSFTVIFNKSKKNYTKNIGKIFLLLILISAIMNTGYYIQEKYLEYNIFQKIARLYIKGKEGYGGGAFGAIISLPLITYLKKTGALIIIATASMIDIILITELSIENSIKKIIKKIKRLFKKNIKKQKFKKKIEIKTYDDDSFNENNNTKKSDQVSGQIDLNDLLIEDEKEQKSDEEPVKASPPDKSMINKINSDIKTNIETEKNEYIKPPLSLLKNPKKLGSSINSLKKNAYERSEVLVETLKSFNVDAEVVNISLGPSVTQYELSPSKGVKVRKIVNLADDIALNLAASDVRIEAPIPGKSVIGIEVPNKSTSIVHIKEIIASENFKSSKSKLAFALGKNISGKCMIADISKMPHLLIAGATGSGKSVCINNLIASILFNATPKEVKMILIDPKVVELNMYNGIPHLLIPVVTDARKAAGSLVWAVNEMENRYDLFAEKSVKDFKSYNKLINEENQNLEKDEKINTLPQILIIIDELSDLMMIAPNEVEDAICRLAQMARAAGIHLVLATQRPSVNVITGLIKANIPSRISFAVSSQVDSRTILDMGGAEKLLGNGDMLFYPTGYQKPVRIQGALITDKEVEKLVSFLKSNSKSNYNEDIQEEIEKDAPNSKNSDQNDDHDELLPEAIKIVVDAQQASASMLQRKLSVGYARAGRLVDQMAERNIVGPFAGSKPRDVLITKEEYMEMKMKNEDEKKNNERKNYE